MRRALAVFAAGAALAGCSASADVAAAERGVAEFRRMMEAGQYRRIYTSAADAFRQTSSEQAAIRFLETVQTRLGPVRRSTRQGWHFNRNTGGTTVTLVYATEFARGRGRETFVFRGSGEHVRLGGYNINSMDLMMDRAAGQPGNEAKPD